MDNFNNLKNKHLIICHNTPIIKGFRKSAIYDLQKNLYVSIPNSMYYVIMEMNQIEISKYLETYNKQEKKIIYQYLNFLYEKEFAFFVDIDEINLFPKFKYKFETPSILSNVIIEIQIHKINLIKTILYKIESLGCKDFQIIFKDDVSLDSLYLFIKLLKFSSFKSLEIIIDKFINIDIPLLLTLIQSEKRIKNILIFKGELNIIHPSDNHMGNLIIQKNSRNQQEIFEPNETFTINELIYSEALSKNIYYNKKAFIDEYGNVKNSYSGKSFGKINNLKNIIQKETFQEFWSINKDKSLICRDCEFRHMCMDCRAYIKNPNDIYSQPAKCPYNPYIAKWQGQEGYITVEQWQKQNPNWEQQAKEQRQTTY